MNKKELIELLDEIALKDLADGSNIYDHPCSVAVRAITKCFDDINYFKERVDKIKPRSKKAMMMLKLNYNPQW